MTVPDIEQPDFKLQRRLSAKVGAVAHLREVRLTGLTFAIDEDFSWSDQLVVNLTYERGWQRLGEHFFAAIRAKVDAQPEAAISAGMHLTAEHMLVYELPVEAELSDDELASFVVVSGTFAAHPYVREIVQNVTARGGFPAVVLDVWRSPLDD